jgi:aminoglycoside phosphotransferase family enzyme
MRATENDDNEELTLAEKVSFLSQPQAYVGHVPDIVRRETHMSWVFMAGDRVYKLKKPVRFPYLDFSTLARRETACRAELSLNRRLAPDVYIDVLPLVMSDAGLAIGGAGITVDWMVVMRRLNERYMLEQAIFDGRATASRLDRLVDLLSDFYSHASRSTIPAVALLADWKRSLAYNRRILLDPRLGMPIGPVQFVDQVQRRFLAGRANILVARINERRIVDGHGDLRPEHIWLGDPICIIDCLEFNARLRAVDPFDEIAFLSLECERLGARWIGDYIVRRMKPRLRDGPSGELFTFYRCHRATLRARLAIAHLLEPNPRTPEKWPRLARAYLNIALADAAVLQRLLRTPSGRSSCGHRAVAAPPPPAVAQHPR